MLLSIELKTVTVNHKHTDVTYFNVGNVLFKYTYSSGNGTEMIFLQNSFRCTAPTRIVCRNWGSNFSVLGPRCQYNFVEHRTLIYVSGSYAVGAKIQL